MLVLVGGVVFVPDGGIVVPVVALPVPVPEGRMLGNVVGVEVVTVCRRVGVSGWVLPVPTLLLLVGWVLVVGVGQVVGLVGVLRWGYFHWAKWRPSSVRALPARLVTMPEVADPS
ncbi:hypothetical protein ACIP10_37180, partial [Streptomyces galbus]|uniref:hypothetical protein n=1 Tax=Streptomyces galbus TaxID=33898 RepID=UPI0037FB3301